MSTEHPTVRHVIELRVAYEQHKGTRPLMPYLAGNPDGDRDRIVEWVMDAIPGVIADEDGDEAALLVEAIVMGPHA